jgi:hypothetical protein
MPYYIHFAKADMAYPDFGNMAPADAQAIADQFAASEQAQVDWLVRFAHEHGGLDAAVFDRSLGSLEILQLWTRGWVAAGMPGIDPDARMIGWTDDPEPVSPETTFHVVLGAALGCYVAQVYRAVDPSFQWAPYDWEYSTQTSSPALRGNGGSVLALRRGLSTVANERDGTVWATLTERVLMDLARCGFQPQGDGWGPAEVVEQEPSPFPFDIGGSEIYLFDGEPEDLEDESRLRPLDRGQIDEALDGLGFGPLVGQQRLFESDRFRALALLSTDEQGALRSVAVGLDPDHGRDAARFRRQLKKLARRMRVRFLGSLEM